MFCQTCPLLKIKDNWCDKIGGTPNLSNNCENLYDALSPIKELNSNSKTKRNRNYRRHQNRKKDLRLRRLIDAKWCYAPHIGYFLYIWIDGELVKDRSHIRYPKDSKCRKWIKKQSSKRVRKTKGLSNGGGYRKVFDYWWTLY